MSDSNIGDSLNRVVTAAKSALFEQSELAELTFSAFVIAASTVNDFEKEEIEITYPVGWSADNQPIQTTQTYPKQDLINKYTFLSYHQLAVHGLYQIVAITEAMLSDIVRTVVVKYPQKLGSKKTIPIQYALESTSIDELHIRATDSLINDLSYKSPRDFAETLDDLISSNLLECPAFHQYIEVKATRDIYVHSRGIANDTYVRKAASHVRVQAGANLPVTLQYFFQSYESCLQLIEWLETQLHDKWHSQEFEARKDAQLNLNLPKHSDEMDSEGPGLIGEGSEEESDNK